jgi:hypothetical protein
MSQSGGAIMCVEAYAQGKMLNHSGWNGVLARGITPSDIDFYVESSGCYLFAEFSRDCVELDCLSRGQQLAYTRLARRPNGDAVAICRHSVPRDREIDTKTDVEACTVYFLGGTKSVLLSNDQWQQLVTKWAANPADAVWWLESLHDAIAFVERFTV